MCTRILPNAIVHIYAQGYQRGNFSPKTEIQLIILFFSKIFCCRIFCEKWKWSFYLQIFCLLLQAFVLLFLQIICFFQWLVAAEKTTTNFIFEKLFNKHFFAFNWKMHLQLSLRLILQMCKHEKQTQVFYKFYFQLTVIWAWFRTQSNLWEVYMEIGFWVRRAAEK